MGQQGEPPAPRDEPSAPRGTPDPWAALGRLAAGVAVYGFLGWLGDRWLDTQFLTPVGIVVGAGLGLVATFAATRSQ